MPSRPDTTADSTPEGYVCLCVIGPAHGVRGAVKAKCFTDDALALAAYGPLQTAKGEAFTITSVKPDKLGARLTLKGVDSREAAEALRGTALYAAREKLPPLPDDDDFYHDDLVGLRAIDETGAALGVVEAVHNFGAGDLLEIDGAFYPFTKAVVPQVDIAAGQLTLKPPKEDEARPPEQISEHISEHTSEHPSRQKPGGGE